MDNERLAQMVSLRRDGLTMKAIADRVGVSERTVRRYVRGVEPDLRLPSREFDLETLVGSFYDPILEHRRLVGRDESVRPRRADRAS